MGTGSMTPVIWTVQRDTTDFSIDRSRLVMTADLAGVDLETAKGCLLADWPEGQEHQNWLDSAAPVDLAETGGTWNGGRTGDPPLLQTVGGRIRR